MAKKNRRWICHYCRKLNESNKRKCIWCGEWKVGDKSKLIRDLDGLVSKYTLKTKGRVCITCGKPATDAGHYRSRGHMMTRWYLNNIHPQCVGCNRFCNGRLDEYALYIVNKYGQDELKKIHRMSNIVFQPTKPWLLEKIKEYKSKLEALWI